MEFILVIFTVVGTISAGSSSTVQYDWRPIGEFRTLQACNNARESLGDAAKQRTRCLNKY